MAHRGVEFGEFGKYERLEEILEEVVEGGVEVVGLFEAVEGGELALKEMPFYGVEDTFSEGAVLEVL